MPDAELTCAEMRAWGEALGARLAPASVVTLQGELGAGKTTLVQAICRGYGVREAVTSPTFALLHEYSAPRSPVFHFDLFRLEGPHELANLAWDDAFGSGALVLVEWPERAGDEARFYFDTATALRLRHVSGVRDRRWISW